MNLMEVRKFVICSSLLYTIFNNIICIGVKSATVSPKDKNAVAELDLPLVKNEDLRTFLKLNFEDIEISSEIKEAALNQEQINDLKILALSVERLYGHDEISMFENMVKSEIENVFTNQARKTIDKLLQEVSFEVYNAISGAKIITNDLATLLRRGTIEYIREDLRAVEVVLNEEIVAEIQKTVDEMVEHNAKALKFATLGIDSSFLVGRLPESLSYFVRQVRSATLELVSSITELLSIRKVSTNLLATLITALAATTLIAANAALTVSGSTDNTCCYPLVAIQCATSAKITLEVASKIIEETPSGASASEDALTADIALALVIGTLVAGDAVINAAHGVFRNRSAAAAVGLASAAAIVATTACIVALEPTSPEAVAGISVAKKSINAGLRGVDIMKNLLPLKLLHFAWAEYHKINYILDTHLYMSRSVASSIIRLVLNLALACQVADLKQPSTAAINYVENMQNQVEEESTAAMHKFMRYMQMYKSTFGERHFFIALMKLFPILLSARHYSYGNLNEPDSQSARYSSATYTCDEVFKSVKKLLEADQKLDNNQLLCKAVRYTMNILIAIVIESDLNYYFMAYKKCVTALLHILDEGREVKLIENALNKKNVLTKRISIKFLKMLAKLRFFFMEIYMLRKTMINETGGNLNLAKITHRIILNCLNDKLEALILEFKLFNPIIIAQLDCIGYVK